MTKNLHKVKIFVNSLSSKPVVTTAKPVTTKAPEYLPPVDQKPKPTPAVKAPAFVTKAAIAIR